MGLYIVPDFYYFLLLLALSLAISTIDLDSFVIMQAQYKKNIMLEFIVVGPCKIGFEANRGIKRINRVNVEDFWEDDHLEVASKRGCYVFALQKQRAIIPYYVGKAAKGFEQEIFTSHKLEKYNDVLHIHTFGTPTQFGVGCAYVALSSPQPTKLPPLPAN